MIALRDYDRNRATFLHWVQSEQARARSKRLRVLDREEALAAGVAREQQAALSRLGRQPCDRTQEHDGGTRRRPSSHLCRPSDHLSKRCCPCNPC